MDSFFLRMYQTVVLATNKVFPDSMMRRKDKVMLKKKGSEKQEAQDQTVLRGITPAACCVHDSVR